MERRTIANAGPCFRRRAPTAARLSRLLPDRIRLGHNRRGVNKWPKTYCEREQADIEPTREALEAVLPKGTVLLRGQRYVFPDGASSTNTPT
jgi:hypothetical protein